MKRVNRSKKFLPSIQGCTPLFSYSHFRIDSRYQRIRQCMCVSPLVHRMIYYFYLTAVPRLGNQQADDEERCPHRGRIISPDEIRSCPQDLSSFCQIQIPFVILYTYSSNVYQVRNTQRISVEHLLHLTTIWMQISCRGISHFRDIRELRFTFTRICDHCFSYSFLSQLLLKHIFISLYYPFIICISKTL